MKIKYLGTGAAEGWPALFCNCDSCIRARKLGGKNIRTRSQALIDDRLLLDISPDTYMHMLNFGLDLPHIHHVLVTHTHQDHYYIDEFMMRSDMFANDLDGSLTVYGNDAVVKKFWQIHGTESYHARIGDRLRCIELKEFITTEIAGIHVTPLLANHNKAEKCYIYLLEKENRTILYGNDTGYFPEETWEYLKHVKMDLVSLDCTQIKYRDGKNHMGIPDVIDTRERMQRIKCVKDDTKYILTHFSHNGVLLHHELEAAVAPLGLIPAFDGFEMEC